MDFNPIKVAAWVKHQQDWTESGLSQSEYCRRTGIGYSTFYTWRKRLGTITADVLAERVVAPEKSTAASHVKPAQVTARISSRARPLIAPSKLVPVSIKVPLPEIVIHSPAGWQVIISNHVDLPELAQLLRHIP